MTLWNAIPIVLSAFLPGCWSSYVCKGRLADFDDRQQCMVAVVGNTIAHPDDDKTSDCILKIASEYAVCTVDRREDDTCLTWPRVGCHRGWARMITILSSAAAQDWLMVHEILHAYGGCLYRNEDPKHIRRGWWDGPDNLIDRSLADIGRFCPPAE